MATEDKFWNVEHENYDWSTETMSWVPANGTIWWYDDNGYIFSIVGNGTDDVETLRADQIEAYTQAVTKAGCQCDIDGEGIHQIPDNPDGVDISNYTFSEVPSGWTCTNGDFTIEDEVLRATATADGLFINSYIVQSLKQIIFKVRLSKAGILVYYLGGVAKYLTLDALEWGYVSTYDDVEDSNIFNLAVSGTETAGDYIEIGTLYIGDGSYLTGTPDHSGTQSPAINTAVTPIDSKWGKLGHYNGVTSNLEFDNPVIGASGTIRLNTQNIVSGYFFANNDLTADGLRARYDTTYGFVVSFFSGSEESLIYSSYDPESSVLHLVFGGTSALLYDKRELVASKTLSNTIVAGTLNLFIGSRSNNSNNLDGDESFNYTTEQFTADQVKSDYDNPRKFSNEPVSQTPTAYTMSQHDKNGHTLMEFATKTATSEGNQGAIAFDATNVYFCIADSSWMKIPLESI